MNKCNLCNDSKTINCFCLDVLSGLTAKRKSLSSKYFYDQKGSILFDQITQQPEYYLTQSEYEIIDTQSQLMFASLGNKPFDLFELGCGNNGKTAKLIDTINRAGQVFHYHPIDISPSALAELELDLHRQFPFLNISSHAGDYEKILSSIGQLGNNAKKVVLFLGGNIGNYQYHESVELLSKIAQSINSGDFLIMGMDLKKNIDKMTAAYNDQAGITAQFNLNLLTRINTELEANFKLDQFTHHEIYDPVEGAMKSYLVATQAQSISLKALNVTIDFDAYEAISVERSMKYSIRDISNLAQATGFFVKNNFFDKNQDFVDSLWQRI